MNDHTEPNSFESLADTESTTAQTRTIEMA